MRVYILLAVVCIVSLILVNTVFKDPDLNDTRNGVTNATHTGRPLMARATLLQRIKDDSLNVKNHFELIRNDGGILHDNVHKDDFSSFSLVELRNRYIGYTHSADQKLRDIGNFALGAICYYQKDCDSTSSYFEKVADKKMPELNFLLGEQAWRNDNRKKAEEYYLAEIAAKGDTDNARKALAWGYYQDKNDNAFLSLASVPHSYRFLPTQPAFEIFFTHGKWIPYIVTLFYAGYHNLNLIAILAAIAFALVWFVYMRRVDIYNPERFAHLMLQFALGALFSYLVFPLEDLLRLAMGVSFVQDMDGNFWYWLFNVGFIEEIAKIIPFLLLLRFSRFISEPIDYIIYASLSALGFSMVENLVYFQSGSIDTIMLRGLVPSIMHMAQSSFIAYGLVLSRYGKKMNPVAAICLYLPIAALVHGTYDFLIANGASGAAMLFIGLPAVFFWGFFINNALNQSALDQPEKSVNQGRTLFFLHASFVIIFMAAFVAEGYLYGPTATEEHTSTGLAFVIPILALTSYRLGTYNIIPGYWEPMRLQFITFFQSGYDIIGRDIVIHPFIEDSFFEHDMLATVVKNLDVEDETWHMIALHEPVTINSTAYNEVVICAKDDGDPVGLGKSIISGFMLISDGLNLDAEEFAKSDFLFVEWVKINPVWRVKLGQHLEEE